MRVHNVISPFTSWWQHHSVTLPLCDPCCDSYQQTSAMATVDKKRKADVESRPFQERWKLQYIFTENQSNCVWLICQETVVMYKYFNVKRHYQTNHANASYQVVTMLKE